MSDQSDHHFNTDQRTLKREEKVIINYQCLGNSIGDQGVCGACYAFAVTDTIAMILAGKTGVY